MSVIAQIDSKTAKVISKYLCHDTGGRLFLSENVPVAAGMETLNLELIELQNLGILTGIASNLSTTVKSNHKEGSDVLTLSLSSTLYTLKLGVNCLILTNVGKELLQLLPMEPLKRTASRIKELCLPTPIKVFFMKLYLTVKLSWEKPNVHS